MSEWNRFDFTALHDPRLKMFRAGSRWKVLQLVEISLRDNTGLGLILLFDDEIARDLGLALDSWLSLRDRLILRRVIRQVGFDDGQKAYEIAYWLLPKQTSADGKLRDARRDGMWDANPALPLDLISDETDESGGGRGGAMSSAERQALFKARLKARNAGQQEPVQEAFLAAYRAMRSTQCRKLAVAQTEESVSEEEIDRSVTVTENSSVTEKIGNGNGNTLAQERGERKEENEREENNNSSSLGGNGNDSKTTVTVTADKNVTDVEAERKAVVALLADAGIIIAGEPVRIARHVAVELAAKFPAERIYRQIEYLPFRRKTKGEWAGLLRTAIEDDYGAPGEWHKHNTAQAEKQRQAVERKANLQKRGEREAQAANEKARLMGLLHRLHPDVQQSLISEAEGRLSPIYHNRLLKSREAGEPVSALLQVEIDTHLFGLLREKAGTNEEKIE